MSFIQHTACPKCGSKDNLGEYSDHWYCFGCRYYKLKHDLQSVRERLVDVVPKDDGDISLTVSEALPKQAMQWLLSYGITGAHVSEYSWGWVEDRSLLVLVNTPTYWQARNFGPGVKYLSKGNKPLLSYGNGGTIVCVEDVLSAVKISKANEQVTVIPLLGSSVSPELEQTLFNRGNDVILWLDRDKATSAVKQARSMLGKGIRCSVLVTELDPKEYSAKEINEWLSNKL